MYVADKSEASMLAHDVDDGIDDLRGRVEPLDHSGPGRSGTGATATSN
jgi:hypothetical protein